MIRSLRTYSKRLAYSGIAAVIMVSSIALRPSDAHAAPSITLAASAVGTGTSLATTAFSLAAGERFIGICTSTAADTLTLTTSIPSGAFTTVHNNTGGANALRIFTFNNLSAGSKQYTCTSNASGTLSVAIFRITGLSTEFVVNSFSATGTTFTAGPVSSSYEQTFAFAVATAKGSVTPSGTWTNGFSQILNIGRTSGSGSTHNRTVVSTLTSTATGNYSTVTTGGSSVPWLTALVLIRAPVPAFKVEVVNSSGVPISSPVFPMNAAVSQFTCQTVTGAFGSIDQKVNIVSDETASWSLALAATGGPTAVWSDGAGHSYKYNSANGDACTTGQLSITRTTTNFQTTCGSWTGVSRPTGTALFNPIQNSITIASASGAAVGCIREFYGAILSQSIPAETPSGTYSLGLTLTLTAS